MCAPRTRGADLVPGNAYVAHGPDGVANASAAGHVSRPSPLELGRDAWIHDTLTATPPFGTASVAAGNRCVARRDARPPRHRGPRRHRRKGARRRRPRHPARDGSIWVPSGENLVSAAARSESSATALGGRTVGADQIGAPSRRRGRTAPSPPPRSWSAERHRGRPAGEPIAARRTADFSPAERDALRRLTASAGAAMASANRLAASQRRRDEAARELALITEMSREITSTLDLDRVLRSVVNLASKAFTFDRGAVALYEHGVCDIRAVAGADGVDAKDPALQDLAVRAAWAAGLGESFYLSERTDPGSDAERTFVQIFGEDLERDGAMSGLYLPLKDEEGIVGILLFEADRADFATPRERDARGDPRQPEHRRRSQRAALSPGPAGQCARRVQREARGLLELPARRRATYAAIAVAALAAAHAHALADARRRLRAGVPSPRRVPTSAPRSPASSIACSCAKGCSSTAARPIAHLRDDELRAQRDAALAAVAAAEREAAIAASRGDAAEERLQRLRVDVLRREVELLDEQFGSSVVRSPVHGVVLTPRPDERVGSHVDAGDAARRRRSHRFARARVRRRRARHHARARRRRGRLRVAALPQQTFTGRVSSIAAAPSTAGSDVRSPSAPSSPIPTRCSVPEWPRMPVSSPSRRRSSGASLATRVRATRLWLVEVLVVSILHSLRRAVVCSPRSLSQSASVHGEARSASPQQAGTPRGAGTPVAEFIVDTSTVQLPIELPAQLYVEHDAVVVARSAGTIQQLDAELGDRVGAGQLLARLENADQTIALASAEASYEGITRVAARTRLLKKGGGPPPPTPSRSSSSCVRPRSHAAKRSTTSSSRASSRHSPASITSRLARPGRFVRWATHSSASPSQRRSSRASRPRSDWPPAARRRFRPSSRHPATKYPARIVHAAPFRRGERNARARLRVTSAQQHAPRRQQVSRPPRPRGRAA